MSLTSIRHVIYSCEHVLALTENASPQPFCEACRTGKDPVAAEKWTWAICHHSQYIPRGSGVPGACRVCHPLPTAKEAPRSPIGLVVDLMRRHHMTSLNITIEGDKVRGGATYAWAET